MNLLSPIGLAVMVLAAFAVQRLWFHPDSFLAERRAVTEEWKNSFLRKLFNCQFCLSYWLPAFLVYQAWVFEPYLLFLSLAVTGAVQILNDLLRPRTEPLGHFGDWKEEAERLRADSLLEQDMARDLEKSWEVDVEVTAKRKPQTCEEPDHVRPDVPGDGPTGSHAGS